MKPAEIEAVGGGRSYSRAYKAGAIAAILVLVLGGGWASISPYGRAASPRGAGVELAVLGRRLRPENIGARSPGEAASAAESLVGAAGRAGADPREALEDAFPEPRRILGMLALDRDVDDFLDYATRDDAIGDYYRDQARISGEMRGLRSRYEAAFAAADKALLGDAVASPGEVLASAAARTTATSAVADKLKPPYIAAPDEVWLPPTSDLPLSHPYALDVFFQSVDRSGEAEKGPRIRALYPGIVVAASSDWAGGQGPSKWKGGGLSPAAGNGVVIYDPSARVYCSYFHLNTVALRTGAVVKAGETVGRGGNSGVNARKKGHGDHVHVEIFDAARDTALSSYEILKLLKK